MYIPKMLWCVSRNFASFVRGSAPYAEAGCHCRVFNRYLQCLRKLRGALLKNTNQVLEVCCPVLLSKVFIFLSIARFILGIGVGGVYPLAATVAAEGSSSSNLGGKAGHASLQIEDGVGFQMRPHTHPLTLRR